MSKAVDSIYIVMNNPFAYEEVFNAFFTALGYKRKSMMLAYLVLPVVLNESSRKKLRYLNRNSNIISFVKDRDSMLGLQTSIENMKDLTNRCIQLGLSDGSLSLNDDLVILDEGVRGVVKNSINSELCRTARKLGELIKEYSVVEVYRILGVKML